MDLVYKVARLIERERLIQEGDRVLLGASGGVDSTTLLFVLKEIMRKIPFAFGLAHINHQLRGRESERDEAFVKALAAKFELPCYTERVDARAYADRNGLSLQHAGRDLRYRFFEEIADRHKYDKIAIAHNMDDQVETFFLRLLKGTGIRGLSSIPLRRARIIRPFLYVYRHEIEGYAGTHAISFVEDSSNAKTTYERNFIRKHLVPVMERFNPTFREKVVSLLQDLTPVNEVFDQKAEAFLREETTEEEGDIGLDAKKLMLLDPETRFRVISGILTGMDAAFIPLREHIRLVEKIATGTRPSLAILLPHGIRAKRVYKRLCFTKKPEMPRTEGIFPVTMGENSLKRFMLTLEVEILHTGLKQFPTDRYTAFFDADKLGDLHVRTFLEGDRFMPLGMHNTVKVKDFFMARKVPREKRRQVPLLISDPDIVWIVGYRIDERYKVEDSTRRILKITARTYQ